MPAVRKYQPCRCGRPGCRRCRISEGMRLAYAEGRRRPAPRWTDWTSEEESVLAEWIGRVPHDELGRMLGAQFGNRVRTPKAVELHAWLLGLQTGQRGLCLQQVADLFGVNERTVHNFWIAHGLLKATRFREAKGPTSKPQWCIAREDLEAFVRATPWAYDWQNLPRGSRLRALADLVQRCTPWLTAKEASRRFRVPITTVRDWARRGLVPHQKRPGRQGMLRFRAADVAEFVERHRGALRLEQAS